MSIKITWPLVEGALRGLGPSIIIIILPAAGVLAIFSNHIYELKANSVSVVLCILQTKPVV